MRRLELVPTVPHLFPDTKEAIKEPLFSHRSERFSDLFRSTVNQLRKLSADRFHPVIAAGTGTWANELMVWNIVPGARKVLVISNGEFGDRLLKQCRNCHPGTIALKFEWGEAYDRERIESCLATHPEVDWIFGVATETSCGRANNIELLDEIAAPRGIRIALDGVSAVGLAPKLFRNKSLHVVSASSGKALAGLPGISIVLIDESVTPAAAEHRAESLDLAKLIAAEASSGMVRNTLSSMQLMALESSLRAIGDCVEYSARIGALKERAVDGLRKLGIEPLPGSNSPMVTAFHRPPEPRWSKMLKAWEASGVDVYYRPCYLEERQLFEIAAMGDLHEEDIDRMLGAVKDL
ncbi:MAG: aminotransferase class V-fold PLP-dependent enzyme [Victivallales bacterium]|jgi:aspartate aminotransferase-like enzyme|nr:aminotransferase class V-fold PLP-dependent enzyme [Victivallales bacterium]